MGAVMVEVPVVATVAAVKAAALEVATAEVGLVVAMAAVVTAVKLGEEKDGEAVTAVTAAMVAQAVEREAWAGQTAEPSEGGEYMTSSL